MVRLYKRTPYEYSSVLEAPYLDMNMEKIHKMD